MQENKEAEASVALSLRGVRRRFGEVPAVDDFSLSVASNEVVLPFGPERVRENHSLAPRRRARNARRGRGRHRRGGGINARTHGAFLNGAVSAWWCRITRFFPHLTIGKNVAFGLAQLSRAERKERVARVLRSGRHGATRQRLAAIVVGRGSPANCFGAGFGSCSTDFAVG